MMVGGERVTPRQPQLISSDSPAASFSAFVVFVLMKRARLDNEPAEQQCRRVFVAPCLRKREAVFASGLGRVERAVGGGEEARGIGGIVRKRRRA
jgi:hypothetical protein